MWTKCGQSVAILLTRSILESLQISARSHWSALLEPLSDDGTSYLARRKGRRSLSDIQADLGK